MIHQLKLAGLDYANAVLSGDKNFEIRLADRDYQVGDMLYQSLWDTQAGRYVHHKVSDHLYMVTYVATMNTADGVTNVLGIRKACRSSVVVYSLLEKFRDEGTLCDIVMFGTQYERALIFSVNRKTVEINVLGEIYTIDTKDVLWVSSCEVPEDYRRDVTYWFVGLPDIVRECDFTDEHLYDLYYARALKE